MSDDEHALPPPKPFEALARRLAGDAADELTLTFGELDEIVGDLPWPAKFNPFFWTNGRRADGAPDAWLDAGFRVAAVELQGFVTFVRVRGRLARLEVMRMDQSGVEHVTGTLCLEGGERVEADEGAAWLLGDAFYAALPDGSWPRRVRPGDGAAFLVACWFSLREPGTRGRLVDMQGRELTRDGAAALRDAFAGTGTIPGADEEHPGTDPSWSRLPIRVPDRNDDPDAPRFAGPALEAAAFGAPVARSWPAPPEGEAWRPGADVIDRVERGRRVFSRWFGLGTVLSVVPAGLCTEVLVRYDDGAEDWEIVSLLRVELPSR